jgi:hypothetical protein
MKSSKNKRYDKETKLWIKHRKTIYVWWYKFLQIAIQENRKVNRKFYGGWGDTSIKFDVWWKKNWIRLFGVKKEKDIPLYHLKSIALKTNAYKHRYKVYTLRKQGFSHEEIAKKCHELRPKYRTFDDFQSRKYFYEANKMINNICKGKFP